MPSEAHHIPAPATKNKTNLEVAKLLTIINPRKLLPEAFNVQFDFGEISRVLVSSPWMPPVCDLCKEIGHATKRCPSLIKTYSLYNATIHLLANYPQKHKKEHVGRKTRRGRSKNKHKQEWKVIKPRADIIETSLNPPPAQSEKIQNMIVYNSKLGTEKDRAIGETSGTQEYLLLVLQRKGSGTSRSSNSDIQPDSSDVETSDSELEEGEFSKHELDFEVVRYRNKFSSLKGNMGKRPKNN